MILTIPEFRAITGSTATDYQIQLQINAMELALYGQLGVPTLSRTEIDREECVVYQERYLRPLMPNVENPVIRAELNTGPMDVELAQDSIDRQKYWVKRDGAFSFIPSDRVYVSYEGGYYLQDRLSLEENPEEDDILYVDYLGQTSTYAFKENPSGSPHIQIGNTPEETLVNIMTELGGEIVEDVLFLPQGKSARSQVVDIEPADDISDLKLAVAYLVKGSTSMGTKVEGVTSYRLGSKQVNLSKADADFVGTTIDTYLRKFNRAKVL